MYGEAKKLHLIEEILKIDNDALLVEMETFLEEKKAKSLNVQSNGFAELSGIWTKEEGNEVIKIIEDSCENIDPNEWK